MKRGRKSGSGSKFQEVFALADNFTLSDDTFDNHILDRHGPNSTYGNKSHFNADFDIRNSIDSTLTGDNFIVGPNTAIAKNKKNKNKKQQQKKNKNNKKRRLYF